MHASYLAIAGLLFIGASLAQDDLNAAIYNSNLYAAERENEASPYWWMSKGSPFKRSYETAQVQPQQQRFDFENNPFVGGRPFAAAADSESSAAENIYSNAGSFRAPGYLPPDESVKNIQCQRPSVCVPRYQCQGGYVDASQLSGVNSQVRFINDAFLFFLNFLCASKTFHVYEWHLNGNMR